MKTEDTEALGRERTKPSKIKARYSRTLWRYDSQQFMQQTAKQQHQKSQQRHCTDTISHKRLNLLRCTAAHWLDIISHASPTQADPVWRVCTWIFIFIWNWWHIETWLYYRHFTITNDTQTCASSFTGSRCDCVVDLLQDLSNVSNVPQLVIFLGQCQVPTSHTHIQTHAVSWLSARHLPRTVPSAYVTHIHTDTCSQLAVTQQTTNVVVSHDWVPYIDTGFILGLWKQV